MAQENIFWLIVCALGKLQNLRQNVLKSALERLQYVH